LDCYVGHGSLLIKVNIKKREYIVNYFLYITTIF
jgi:hypothetical protein